MVQTVSSKFAGSNELLGAAARGRLLADLPVTEKRRTLADIPSAIIEGGAGRPIVLLHGPGEHAAKWHRVILRSSHRMEE